MRKKVLALVLSAAMGASMIAGCGNAANTTTTAAHASTEAKATEAETKATEAETKEESTTAKEEETKAQSGNPIEDIAGKYYSYYYYPSADFLMDYFFHFYEEVPGVGNVFYAGFCLNQIVFSGTYEVKEEECKYACWPDREAQEKAGEGATPPEGTAPYTIYFYDMEGKEIDHCGFDGTKLYMDMENIKGTGAEANVFTLDEDPVNSPLSADYEGEQAPVLLSFISPEDETATLELLINGKYNDMVIMAADGTYEANEDLSEIKLTSSDGSADAVVTLGADGIYIYKSADGKEISLTAVNESKAATLYSFVGEVPVPGMEGTNGDLICDFMDDGAVRVYASAMGQEFDLDAGTYEVDMTTYTITATFEKAGTIATYATEAGMNIDYVQAGAELFGDISATLTMKAQ